MTLPDYALHADIPPHIRICATIVKWYHTIELRVYDRDKTEEKPQFVIVLTESALDHMEEISPGEVFAIPAFVHSDMVNWATTGEMPPGWIPK